MLPRRCERAATDDTRCSNAVPAHTHEREKDAKASFCVTRRMEQHRICNTWRVCAACPSLSTQERIAGMGGSQSSYTEPYPAATAWYPEFEKELPDATGKVVAITGCTTVQDTSVLSHVPRRVPQFSC